MCSLLSLRCLQTNEEELVELYQQYCLFPVKVLKTFLLFLFTFVGLIFKAQRLLPLLSNFGYKKTETELINSSDGRMDRASTYGIEYKSFQTNVSKIGIQGFPA